MSLRALKQRGLLVLGLDGMPKTLIERLAQDGVMPFLGEVFSCGRLHRMRACLPEVSNVNWSSFMTGANPGTHGIFGFTDLKPGSYAVAFPSFPDLKTDTFWDELGRAGKRCLVLNQPGCYPVRPIPGALVAGFVAVDLKRAVWPTDHLAALEAMNYKIDIDTPRCKDNADALFEELHACLASRRCAAEYLLRLEPWDYVEVVITGTDRLHHFLWSSCEGDGPERERALEYYRKCDELCRWLAEAWCRPPDPERLMVLSDHGFTGVHTEFMLNAWLRQEGYLRFEREPPESYADIAAETQAFAMDPGRVYLHRKNRYPKGCVEGDGPLEEIKGKLETLEHDGCRVFERVHLRDEVYAGPETPRGPDLLCTPRRGVDVKAALKAGDLFAESRFAGMHTWDDAFFWASRDYGKNIGIADLRDIIIGRF